MTPQSGKALAVWLAANQPQVFQQLVKAANASGQMHGVMDWLSSVGSSLGTAAQSVGSFISSPEGMKTLGTIGGLYLQSQAQKDALKLQVAQAQAGYPPAPVQTIGAGSPYSVPVYIDPITGQQSAFTPSLAQQLMPRSEFTQYLPWLLGGGLALALILKR